LGAAPLDFDAFGQLIAPLRPEGTLAVAVSGGRDSMALLVLASGWAAQAHRPVQVVALTVDHGLRPAAALEARQVADLARQLGVGHVTLKNTKAAVSRAQEDLRALRYRLLLDWCRRNGPAALLLAHHLEDQAETLLLRLARGSGPDGLAAMAPAGLLDGVRVLRPLLHVPRARLEATVRMAGLTWIDDPSNEDQRYARVRMRHALAILAEEGLTPDRVAALARRLARVREVVDRVAADFMAAAIHFNPAGYARIDRVALAAQPEELRLRALSRTIETLRGQSAAPRLERIERLTEELFSRMPVARTLGGCRIIPEDRTLLILRESAAISEEVPLAPGGRARWDGRFQIWLGRTAPPGAMVRALGPEGARALAPARKAALVPLPAQVAPTVPALFKGGKPLVVPALGYVDPKQGEAYRSFRVRFAPPARTAFPLDG